MSRLLKEIAPHNAPGPRAMTTTPCLVCGDDGEGMDCCPAALCTPCLQRAAKAQGSLFRCPLCRDDGAFVIAAKRRGVVANAKATPRYASGDDLTIRRRCNAPRCKAPGGRFVDAAENPLTRHGNTEKWALATCAHCGQTSRHRGCVKRFEGFRCDDCDVQVLERAADDFRRGDRVEARFSGGPRWYGAEVVAVVEEGIRVKYDDDGSLETIRVAARIRHRAAEEDEDTPAARPQRSQNPTGEAFRCEVRRVGGTWHSFASFSLAGRAYTVRGTLLSQLASNDPTCPAWVREQFEARRLGEDADEESSADDDEAALRALRERVERDGGDEMTAARLDALLAGWKGSRRKRYTSGRAGFAYSFIAPDGTEIESISRAAAAVLGTPADQVVEGGIQCEVRRVGDTSWRRFESWADAGRAFNVQPNYLSKIANDDPTCPARAREHYEARRLADNNDDDAPAADEPPPVDNNNAALRALRERVRCAPAARGMRAARLDALLAGWTGSRERRGTYGRPNGFAYSFIAPDGTEITSIGRAAAAVLEAVLAADDEAATTEAPAPAPVAREEDDDDTPGSSAAASVANEPDAALELRQENDELRGEVLRLRESLALAADEPPPTDDDGTALQALRERVRSAPAARGMRAAQLDALLDGWSGSRRPKFRRNGQREGWEYSYTAPGGAKFRSIASAAAAALEAAGEAAARPTPALAPRPSHSHGTRGAAAEAPAAAARPLKVSLVSEAAAREELREHLRGLPGVEASQLDNLLAGWQATRRRRADGTTYSFISPGGEEFTSVSRAAWAACRLAPVERQLRAEAERLRVENDALRNDPAAATRREAKLRAELGRLRVENERLARAAQQPPVVVNHSRRDAGLGAWMAETFDHAVGTEPVVVNQVRPARRVTAGAPVVPPAPAVPAWPAPIEAPIPPLGPRAASLAADNAFRAASALALRNLRDSLHAVETLAASDFQGPMKRPVARLALKAHQLATHVAASETQLAERITWAPPSFWTPDEDWRLERLYSDECAAVDAAGLQGRSVRADFWARAAAALGTSRTAGAVESRWKALRAGTGARTQPWTSNEDERLRTMVGDLGASSDWRAIAARLGNGRTAGGVEARWRGLTSGGGPKRPRWTADEDERLTELVRAAPERASGSARPGMWDRIALSFPDRTASAVEHHWKDRNKKAQRHAMAAPAPPSKTLEKSQKIRCLQDNPKQKGTACRDRYEKYKSATTVKEFYEKEGTPADLDHDIGKGFIEVIQPTPAPSIAGEPDRKKRPREGPAAPRWSPDEEARLREVVEAERKAIAGGAPKAGVWGRVAAALGTNRTGGAVSQHWSAMNRGGTVTGAPGAARWTPDEEQHLRRLVEAERAPRGYIRGSFWDGAAASLGTHRTASALKSHWEVMNGAPRPSKKARTDEPPPPEEADDPFSLRACLASLFSWSPRMGS